MQMNFTALVAFAALVTLAGALPQPVDTELEPVQFDHAVLEAMKPRLEPFMEGRDDINADVSAMDNLTPTEAETIDGDDGSRNGICVAMGWDLPYQRGHNFEFCAHRIPTGCINLPHPWDNRISSGVVYPGKFHCAFYPERHCRGPPLRAGNSHKPIVFDRLPPNHDNIISSWECYY